MPERRSSILIFCIFCICFFAVRSIANSPPHGDMDSLLLAKKTDSLRIEFDKVKYIGEFGTSFYAALSFYPELKNTDIVFKQKDIRTTMQCRPNVLSVFRKSENRRIIMTINRNMGNTKGVILDSLSFNARVGLFAHELAHVVDYHNRSTFGIIKLGFQYLTKRGKTRLEHKIDCIAIWKGLGWQLYEFALHVAYCEYITEDYRELKNSVYLQPSEIKELIEIVNKQY